MEGVLCYAMRTYVFARLRPIHAQRDWAYIQFLFFSFKCLKRLPSGWRVDRAQPTISSAYIQGVANPPIKATASFFGLGVGFPCGSHLQLASFLFEIPYHLQA